GTILTPRHVRSLYATQDVKLPAITLKDLVCLPDSADDHSHQKVATALQKAGLAEFINGLNDNGRDGQTWDQLLSGGQKQKLVLAKILLLRPGILFLDEATSALDMPSVHAFFSAIKDRSDVTLLAVMHDLSAIESTKGINLFNSVVAINKGVAKKITVGTWRQKGKPRGRQSVVDDKTN
ncbi:MAG: ATP-binding cassette domain-containing protein, partial [Nitrospirales bacterium]